MGKISKKIAIKEYNQGISKKADQLLQAFNASNEIQDIYLSISDLKHDYYKDFADESTQFPNYHLKKL